jgi:ribosome-associated protein
MTPKISIIGSGCGKLAGKPGHSKMFAGDGQESHMIRVTPSIAIDEHEINEVFVHASGPGGQNVNKVATAVQLRFDVRRSRSLPEKVKEDLIRLAGKRVTKDGELVIEARRFRTQERNRQDARDRLTDLVRRAGRRPKTRRKTRPTEASRQRRLDSKRRRAATKRLRRSPPQRWD